MRYVIRAAGFPVRVNWRKPENLVRLGILAAVVAAIVAALLLRATSAQPRLATARWP